MSKKHVVVIGSGFAGLSVATHLAGESCSVTLLEKTKPQEVERESLSTRGLFLIWVPVGIGCRTFSTATSLSSVDG